jgi:hypothetical protein
MSYVFAACGAEWKVSIHMFVWVFWSVVMHQQVGVA